MPISRVRIRSLSLKDLGYEGILVVEAPQDLPIDDTAEILMDALGESRPGDLVELELNGEKVASFEIAEEEDGGEAVFDRSVGDCYK